MRLNEAKEEREQMDHKEKTIREEEVRKQLINNKFNNEILNENI